MDNQGNFSETAGGSVGGRLAKIIYPHLNQRTTKVDQIVRRRRVPHAATCVAAALNRFCLERHDLPAPHGGV
jgi:hypothetical protein